MDRRLKIILLWLVLMVGYTNHSLTDLMPQFWGLPVAFEDMPAEQMPVMLLMNAVFFFLIPFLAILLVMYGRARWTRITAKVIAVLYVVMNALHPMELIDYFRLPQALVMPLLLVVSIFIAVETFKLRAPEGPKK